MNCARKVPNPFNILIPSPSKSRNDKDSTFETGKFRNFIRLYHCNFGNSLNDVLWDGLVWGLMLKMTQK